MIKATLKMTIDTRELDHLIVEHPKRASKIIDKAAKNVQGGAKLKTHTYGGSHRDTGAMINGWAVNLSGGGGGGSNIPASENELQAVVGNEVEYSYLWEVGHRGFAPEPSLGDAVEAEREPFERAWRGLLE